MTSRRLKKLTLVSLSNTKDGTNPKDATNPKNDEEDRQPRANVLIADLQLIVEEREYYELIHIHEYPKWNTLEEFMALPNFIYFEAAYNQSVLMHTPPVSQTKPNQTSQTKPNQKTHFKFGDKYIRIESTSGRMDMFLGVRCARSNYRDKELYKYIAQVRESEYPHPSYYEFAKSATDHMPKWARMSYCVALYAKAYVLGWMAINLCHIALRQCIVNIRVNSKKNETTIAISRMKYQPIQHLNDLHMEEPIVQVFLDSMRV